MSRRRGVPASTVAVGLLVAAVLLASAVLADCGPPGGEVGSHASLGPVSAGDRTAKDGANARDDQVPARAAQSGEIRLASGRVYVSPGQQTAVGASADRGARPLLVVLHSFGGTWQRLARIADFTRLVRDGWVVVYGVGRNRSWNAGGCCGWAQSHEVDDVAYLLDVLADVEQRRPDVDTRRVYLTGFSNGAMMTLRALCERPRTFAAGFGVAGQLVTRCAGGAPIHYLEIHGTSDRVVPFEGGRIGWLGVTFFPVPELPGRVAAQAPGSVAKIRTHPCGHVWPTRRTCGLDATMTGLAFVRKFGGSAGYQAAGHRAVR